MDRQQRRVYSWEDSFRSFVERTTTRKELRSFIKKASRRYGVVPPRVYFRTKTGTRGRITSEYDPVTHTISLGYGDCNHAIACHETAHAIADDLYDDDEAHGERWLGIYLDLLEWAKVAPRIALHASAHAKGLRWRYPARRASKKAK